MTCCNWGITILSIIVLLSALWTGALSGLWIKWIIILCALLTIILVWTGCDCKYCKVMPKAKKK